MEKKNEDSPKYPVLTLEKALDIIEILSQESSNGLGITELSNKLNIGKSTVHRILNTLMAYGYVDKVPQKTNYRLSWRFYEIGNIIPLQRRLGNLEYGEQLQELCNKYGETVNLGVRDINNVIIIAKVEPITAVLRANVQLGGREPLHATAVGKVLLSELSIEEIEEILGGEKVALESCTPNTITSFNTLLEEIQKVRQQGYAIDDQEFNIGLVCIAMPIRDYEEKIVAGISVSGPTVRMNLNKIMDVKEGLKASTENLSCYLGSKLKGFND